MELGLLAYTSETSVASRSSSNPWVCTPDSKMLQGSAPDIRSYSAPLDSNGG